MTAELDPNPDAPDPGEPFSKWLQLLRGTVRPVITLGVVGTVLWAFVVIIVRNGLSQDLTSSLVATVVGITGTIVGVWFGSRNK